MSSAHCEAPRTENVTKLLQTPRLSYTYKIKLCNLLIINELATQPPRAYKRNYRPPPTRILIFSFLNFSDFQFRGIPKGDNGLPWILPSRAPEMAQNRIGGCRDDAECHRGAGSALCGHFCHKPGKVRIACAITRMVARTSACVRVRAYVREMLESMAGNYKDLQLSLERAGRRTFFLHFFFSRCIIQMLYRWYWLNSLIKSIWQICEIDLTVW